MQTSLADLLQKIDNAIEDEDFSRSLQLILQNWDNLPDPAPLRERAAMVLATRGRKREAVEVYSLVARHYANAGYPTRAMAAIKQMQNLNPSSTQLLDHFTTLYSVRSPFLERELAQPDLPGPAGKLELETGEVGDIDPLLSQVVAQALDNSGTAERPGALPALPLLSLLPPQALRRLLDFLEYEIYAEAQPIIGKDRDEHDLFWAVSSDLLVADSADRFRIPAGALLGLNTFNSTDDSSSLSVLSQKGSECLRLSRQAVDALAEEFPDFPNRLATLHRHALTEGIFAYHPMFAELDDEARDHLPTQLVGLRLDADTVFVRQNKISPGLYIILEGTVELTRRDDKWELTVDTLHPGDMVGEVGLINPRPAITSAVSKGPAHVLFFSRDDFIPFADQYPDVAAIAEGRAALRVEQIRSAIASYDLADAD